MALGVARGYHSSDPDREAVVAFIKCENGLEGQAIFAIEAVIPAALAAKPGRKPGDIAILYKDYRAGNIIADAVGKAGYEFVRVDTAAPYRKVVLTSWIEDCAAWCSGGWRKGSPQLRGLTDRWLGFHRNRIQETRAQFEIR
jgi:DNA helicase-2/ATP-dependent DNA helicase PcrA